MKVFYDPEVDIVRIIFSDAAINESDEENNCDILYSEDMQHNQIVENKITIINPFI